jgi:hypothetical protein
MEHSRKANVKERKKKRRPAKAAKAAEDDVDAILVVEEKHTGQHERRRVDANERRASTVAPLDNSRHDDHGIVCSNAELEAFLANLGGRRLRAGSQPPPARPPPPLAATAAAAASGATERKRGSLPGSLLAAMTAGRDLASAALSRPRGGSLCTGMNRLDIFTVENDQQIIYDFNKSLNAKVPSIKNMF